MGVQPGLFPSASPSPWERPPCSGTRACFRARRAWPTCTCFSGACHGHSPTCGMICKRGGLCPNGAALRHVATGHGTQCPRSRWILGVVGSRPPAQGNARILRGWSPAPCMLTADPGPSRAFGGGGVGCRWGRDPLPPPDPPAYAQGKQQLCRCGQPTPGIWQPVYGHPHYSMRSPRHSIQSLFPVTFCGNAPRGKGADEDVRRR